MSCQEVRESAAGLASLADDDEDRIAAFAHARTCSGCAEALAEGEKLRSLLDDVPAPPPPSPELLARVRAEIRGELEHERRGAAPVATRRRAWPEGPMAVAAALLVGVAFVVALLEWYHRPVTARVWVEALAVVGIAGAGAAFALLRRSAWMPLGLLGVSIGFALLRGDSHEIVRAHDCTVLELVAAGVALAPAALLVLAGKLRGGVATLAGMSAAGALAGQAALDVVCVGRGRLEHLLVYHAGGVLVALLAGALLAQIPGFRAARARALV